MRLSLQLQYAICGVFDLAYNGLGTPVQIRTISERQGIPTRYLEQIFRKLRRAGLVNSKRGPGGGYVLARPPARISLRDVVEAIGGPLPAALGMPRPRSGVASAHRPDFLWQGLADRLGESLGGLSFEALCGQAVRARVKRVEGEGPMYFI
jgi:Rrf2 family iron-sulfur cluster assembly transcriptional regulator